jgi:hypothetical protein
MKNQFLLLALMICLSCLAIACQNSAQQETAKDTPAETQDLYDTALARLNQEEAESQIDHINQMYLVMGEFRTEVDGLKNQLNQVKAAARTQSAILLNQDQFDGMQKLLVELQDIMEPFTEQMAGVEMHFHVNDLDPLRPNGTFGDPPLANEQVLDQLMEDITETERAILEAL